MGEETEIKFKGPVDYIELRTRIPKDVYVELTELAKSRMTCKGGWDYGNVIRELLWCYKVFWNVNVRLDELELGFNEVRGKVMQSEVSSESKKEIEDKNTVTLLGGRTEKRVLDKEGEK